MAAAQGSADRVPAIAPPGGPRCTIPFCGGQQGGQMNNSMVRGPLRGGVDEHFRIAGATNINNSLL